MVNPDPKNQSPHGPVSLGIGAGGVLVSTYPTKGLERGGVLKPKEKKADTFSVDDCIASHGDVGDPGAYCASVKDKIMKTTYWRGKGKHEADSASGFGQVER